MIRPTGAGADRAEPEPSEPSETASAGQTGAQRTLRAHLETQSDAQTVAGPADVGTPGQNASVDLARIAWLVTVLACLITIAILAVQGYYGYALVTLAVAVSAGINLT
jgi:hypothetical protein